MNEHNPQPVKLYYTELYSVQLFTQEPTTAAGSYMYSLKTTYGQICIILIFQPDIVTINMTIMAVLAHNNVYKNK